MYYGLDKQVVKPTVIGINLNKLLSNSNVIYSEKGLTTLVEDYESKKAIKVNYIEITDGVLFNKLKICVKGVGSGVLLYSYLDMGITGSADNNLFPYNINTFKKYTEKVLNYLLNKYGVKLDNKEMKGEKMEINTTIELNSKFKEYGYLLNCMVLLGSKKYKKNFYLDKENDTTGIVFINHSLQKKVYDKTKELLVKCNINLNKDYMRIEDTLKHQNKISEVFGTNDVYRITDDAIKEYLVKSINRDLIKPMEKHIEASNKKLLKIAKEEYKKNNRKWIQSFIISALTEKINGAPILVDKTQIIDVIAAMITNKSNFNRALKRSNNDLQKLDKYIGNIEKLNEIKSKCLFN